MNATKSAKKAARLMLGRALTDRAEALIRTTVRTQYVPRDVSAPDLVQSAIDTVLAQDHASDASLFDRGRLTVTARRVLL